MVVKFGPRFVHDCDTCVFLGLFEGKDIYVHPDMNGRPGTYVARESDQDSDYTSGGYDQVRYSRALTWAHDVATVLGQALSAQDTDEDVFAVQTVPGAEEEPAIWPWFDFSDIR